MHTVCPALCGHDLENMLTVHVLLACFRTAENADEPVRHDVGRHRVMGPSADQGLCVAERYRNTCKGHGYDTSSVFTRLGVCLDFAPTPRTNCIMSRDLAQRGVTT